MADAEPTSKIRPAYVLISSLAAVVGAFLASRLGVYGTVIGVGVISLVSTLGTDLCIRSLDRTRGAAARTMSRTIELPSSAGNPAVPDEGMTATVALPGMSEPDAETAEVERVSTAKLDAVDGDAAAGADGTDSTGNDRTGWRRWLSGRMPVIATGAAVSFVLALAVITGIESVSGNSLSGDGRTTLGQIAVGIAEPGDRTSDENDQPNQRAPSPETTAPSSDTQAPEIAEPEAETDRSPSRESSPEPPDDSPTPTPEPTEPVSPEPTEPPTEGDGSDGSPTDPADSGDTGSQDDAP